MKTRTVSLIALPLLALGAYAFLGRNAPEESEIEYRYAAVERGELMRSISATGQVVALTSVDVKSKAGGKVIKLAVDEGDIVHKGDLIALIDPSDTKAIVDQAGADLTSANARTVQAEKGLILQRSQAKNDVADARATLEAAKVRLQRARLTSTRQPELTAATIEQARANYEAAVADLDKLQKVTVPQMRREAAVNLSQATVQRDTAVADLKRQNDLLAKGYVAGATVDRAKSTAEAAKSAYETAKQVASTLEDNIQVTIQAQQKAIDRARASLHEAQANSAENEISLTSTSEAEKNVHLAEIALQKAIDNQVQTEISASQVLEAKASTVRNRVSLQNAEVQLESTTVLAPRDGVVTQKYLEEGTIIPPGTSTFAQGTSLVQISDVTQLFVECAVDEADVSNVKLGQKVRITADAYPNQRLDGIVTRVNPAALTENNVTAVKVRVKVLRGAKVKLLPGMNATCEFITLEKNGILVIPSQALSDDGTVRVKTKDAKKPEVRKVEIGETGNDNVEIKSGLKEGEEVVTAEIDLVMLRETQKRMQEAEEGGGLAGGGPSGGKKKTTKSTKK